nr:MAG TPA: helix-turn-helix domain protein [Caudoviricetes sp.]
MAIRFSPKFIRHHLPRTILLYRRRVVKKRIARNEQVFSVNHLTFAQNEYIMQSRDTRNEQKGGVRMILPVIEAERIKHQQTRDDFAASLGVSRRTVQNWQNGTTEMPLSKLVALATRWGLSIDYLLGLDQQEQ